MNIHEAVQARHSVRRYTDRPVDPAAAAELQGMIAELNAKSGLNMQFCLNEPEAFKSKFAHFGMFSGVQNYFALVGPDNDGLDEACGYYGEQLVLRAQQLGLNTCWVLATYNKKKCAAKVGPGEKLCVVITLGYGENQGSPHKSKAFHRVCPNQDVPDWFRRGVEYALLAPTGVNQQDFRFEPAPDGVRASCGRGPCKRIDLGIAKYHFEIGAGKGEIKWI